MTGREGYTPAMAKGLSKTIGDVVGIFKPESVRKIKDPYHNPLTDLWAAHGLSKPQLEWTDDVARSWEYWDDPEIWFNAKPIRQALDYAYGTKMPPNTPAGKELLRKMIEVGEDVPMRQHQAALAHETGHVLYGQTEPSVIRKVLGLDPKADLTDPMTHIHGGFEEKNRLDWLDYLNMTQERGIHRPYFYDNFRPDYWPPQVVLKELPGNRIASFHTNDYPYGSELIPDFFGMVGMGGVHPEEILTRSLPNKGPLLKHLRMDEIERRLK
jgi:hypothetical protein